MAKGPSSITLPLVRASSHVTDALGVMKLRGASAVAASDGTGFRIYSISTLHDANVKGDAERELWGLENVTVPSVSLPEAVTLDLGTPVDYAGQIQEMLKRFGTQAIVASVNLAHDGGVLIAFDDPTGTFERIVRPVYFCPGGGELSSSPGTCSVHGVDYELQT